MYDAESALRQATLQWKTAQSQFEVLMLRPRPQAIAEAKTRIEVAQAAVETAKAQVEQLTIRSPIAGVRTISPASLAKLCRSARRWARSSIPGG